MKCKHEAGKQNRNEAWSSSLEKCLMPNVTEQSHVERNVKDFFVFPANLLNSSLTQMGKKFEVDFGDLN